jgi:allantoin racemase
VQRPGKSREEIDVRARRIVYITPGGADPFVERYQSVLGAAALPGTEVTCVHLELAQEPLTPFLSEYPFYYGELFRTINRLEREGADAAIIGCSADPGLFDARRMARIAITAPLEANLRIAEMLGRRVAIIVPGDIRVQKQYAELARLYGLEHVVAWIQPVDLNYPGDDELTRLMATDRARLCELVLDCHRRFLEAELAPLAERAIAEFGADAFFFGCTLWTGMLDNIEEQLGCPVFDPAIGALRSAELLADVLALRQAPAELIPA